MFSGDTFEKMQADTESFRRDNESLRVELEKVRNKLDRLVNEVYIRLQEFKSEGNDPSDYDQIVYLAEFIVRYHGCDHPFMTRYNVSVELSGSATFYVMALSEDDARERVDEGISDTSLCDWVIEREADISGCDEVDDASCDVTYSVEEA